MSLEQSPVNAYLRTRVLTATPEQLRLMLLEGALKFARQGRQGLAMKNYELSFTGISQCRDIILELIASMRNEVDPELCQRVRALYTFIYSQLVEASMERNLEKLDRAIDLLEFERQTWVMLIEQLASERAATPDSGQPDQRAALSVQA
jgi:flagellar secretion chaperone FliS